MVLPAWMTGPDSADPSRPTGSTGAATGDRGRGGRDSDRGSGREAPPATASHGAAPDVFLDISIGSRPLERIVIRLYDRVVPRTAKNFRCLCKRELCSEGVGLCSNSMLILQVRVNPG
jgi:hypothetical protein